ncbi:MAG: homoserine O-succinyltransferase, partial [Ruthenibacterium sp.]
GLYYHYGIKKFELQEKRFGVFNHKLVGQAPLLYGFDDTVYIPHSRHTEVCREDVKACEGVYVLLDSKEAGVALAISSDGKQIFATGHAEYDPWTLGNEYKRDLERDLPIQMPHHYFIDNDMDKGPDVRWRSHAYILFSNWLNYYVYQVTPYDLGEISGRH